MNIRRAKIEDLKTINQYLVQMNLSKLDENSFNQLYRKIYVLIYNKNLVAFIIFTMIEPSAELESIYVKPEYRQNKFSTQLMKVMIEEAQKSHYNAIFLEVREHNEIAKTMYLKNGFKEISKRKKYYGTEDGLVMKKELR